MTKAHIGDIFVLSSVQPYASMALESNKLQHADIQHSVREGA